MQSKNSLSWIQLMSLFLGVILNVLIFYQIITKNSDQDKPLTLIENTATSSNQERANVGLPIRLKIPSISVDAPVEYVALTSEGAMDISEDLKKVAWFNIGPRPGEDGSAVIAGHYGWKNNTQAVFDNLHKLSIGDEIFVEDEKKGVITFVVREVRVYGKDEAAPDVFNSSDGKAHLNLVTCAGTWNKTEKTRSERLIVFTDKKVE